MKTCGCHDALPCGCCAGSEALTPESEFNRPGLSALHYRAGTHWSFLETMEAALSRDHRLDGLCTRASSDASIALIDAWATVGDVLTFYQERIANEGFLATATERRSVLELANLVGYRPRPGVSASVFLAYTLDDGAETSIPMGSLVRSVPADGESQQAFETSELLQAEAAWNDLQVRLTRPHTKSSILTEQAVYLKGVVSSIRKGDPLFVQFAAGDAALCRVLDVAPDAAAGRTKVSLEEWTTPPDRFQPSAVDGLVLANKLRPFLEIEDFGLTVANSTVKRMLPILQRIVDALDSEAPPSQDDIDEIETFLDAHPPRAQKAEDWVEAWLPIFSDDGDAAANPVAPVSVDDVISNAGLLEVPSLAPKSQYHRTDDIQGLFNVVRRDPKADLLRAQVAGPALATLMAFRPAFRTSLALALASARVTPEPDIRVYSVTRTAPFGYNAGPMATTNRGDHITTTWGEWPLDTVDSGIDATGDRKIDLEKEFDKVGAGMLLAFQNGSGPYYFPKDSPKVETASRAAYGLAGKVTRLTFRSEVLTLDPKKDLSQLRPIKVFLASDLLPLAEQPVTDPVCGSDPAIELDGLYDGLTPGKWIILSGEREDTKGTSGVQATELLLIGDVQHQVAPNLPGDHLHTFLRTVVPSAYCYKRDTAKIYGNIVKATNGETRKEVLGSGDASIVFQQFALKQPPLTYLPAATASGSTSTLRTYVNDMEWSEVSSPVGLGSEDRRFFTRTANDGTTSVIFGNGVTGSRLPTGNANVRAAYRNGIGKGGNVQPGQLSILGSKPLGVKEVTNPLRASGGADKDRRDQIRGNAPLSVTALDRLVSVEDYANFARTFAGIGKANSVSLTDGHRQLVHITIAGIDDIPIDVTSDLYLNLRRALHLYGDSLQPLQLDVRAAKFLVLQAGVKVDPDYPWETVAPKLRASLLEAFQFDRRDLGQGAYLSEVLDVLQRVPGVEFVDADKFGSLSEDQLTPTEISDAIRRLERKEKVGVLLAHPGSDGITPAGIAYFTPAVPATIALNQL
jgi:predicted phage baseplate assembly protein